MTPATNDNQPSPLTICVSHIRHTGLRRAAIVGLYPLLTVLHIIGFTAWAVVLATLFLPFRVLREIVGGQVTLLSTAAQQWKASAAQGEGGE